MNNMISERIKILLDNDMQIVDFLADLHERSILPFIDKAITEGKESICLVANCDEDHLFVVILYNAPFELDVHNNKLMLFAHSDIRVILKYFCEYMGTIDYEKHEIRLALKDIIATVQYHAEKVAMRQTQTNYLG